MALASRVLMFDPIAQDAAASGNTSWKTEVNKTGAGEWVLGGKSNMLGNSSWNIGQGTFTLANIRYYANETSNNARVSLAHNNSSFTLQKGATLRGQGNISAGSISLNGVVDPAAWVNVGVRADSIGATIDEGLINTINISNAAADGGSKFGHLTFKSNDVVLGEHFEYQVQIDPANGNPIAGKTHDLITINGDAIISDNASFFIGGAGANNWDELADMALHADYKILEASGTLTNHANLASVTEGGRVPITAT